MFKISKVKALEVLDSRGYPTVKAFVKTEGGHIGSFSVPAGASKGKGEVVELRDGGKQLRGRRVRRAVATIQELIAPLLIGVDVRKQEEIDRIMIEADGSPNKSNFGGNSILAVSIACAKAAAKATFQPLYRYIGGVSANLLPVPLLNVINGGLHAGNELSIQEFMIIPADFSAFKEAILAAAEIYHNLRDYLVSKYGISAKNVGDEGGFAPPMYKTREALDALIKAIEESGYSGKVYLGIDCAASNFYDSQTRKYRIDGKEVDAGDLIEFYVELVRDYPIMSIEDPFEEEDFLSFAELTKKIGDRVQLVGDDFFVTNQNRLKKGIEMGAGNSLLLKVNQIGTLTEALEAARIAYKAGYSVIVSHRSGETTDTAISDLAVGIGCGQIKAGAPARGERVAKYNRLLEIEEELGKRAVFAGKKALRIG